jgi:hypothetical protein
MQTQSDRVSLQDTPGGMNDHARCYIEIYHTAPNTQWLQERQLKNFSDEVTKREHYTTAKV